MSKRMYFLDNLRGVTILMVVLLHVCLCYMKYAPSWWFVINPEQNMFFTYCVMLLDVPIMAIMFFIAGYFALPSMQRYGVDGFWVHKIRRIIVPWVLGVVFLSPPAMYMILLSRGKATGYLDFWFGEFWTGMYSQSVFWFLGLLVLFYLILTGCYKSYASLRNPMKTTKSPSVAFPMLFVGTTTLLFWGMNFIFPVDTWISNFYVIVFQPLRVPVYLLYFALGMLACKRRWFDRQGFTPKLVPWFGIAIVSALIYLHFKGLMASRSSEVAIRFGNALGFNLFAFSTMMTCFAFFKRFLDTANPFWKSFAVSSYGIYLFHSLVVYYGAYYLLGLSVSPFIKAALLLTGTVLFCWILTVALKRNKIVSSLI